MDKGKENLVLLQEIIKKHLANPEEADVTLGGYGLLSVGLCRAALIQLYSETPQLGGLGWRGAVNEGNGLWAE
jgi:hypothetical protein